MLPYQVGPQEMVKEEKHGALWFLWQSAAPSGTVSAFTQGSPAEAQEKETLCTEGMCRCSSCLAAWVPRDPWKLRTFEDNWKLDGVRCGQLQLKESDAVPEETAC